MTQVDAAGTNDSSNFFIFPIGLVTQGQLFGVNLPDPRRQNCIHPLLLGEDFLGHAHARENFADGAGVIGEGWAGGFMTHLI